MDWQGKARELHPLAIAEGVSETTIAGVPPSPGRESSRGSRLPMGLDESPAAFCKIWEQHQRSHSCRRSPAHNRNNLASTVSRTASVTGRCSKEGMYNPKMDQKISGLAKAD